MHNAPGVRSGGRGSATRGIAAGRADYFVPIQSVERPGGNRPLTFGWWRGTRPIDAKKVFALFFRPNAAPKPTSIAFNPVGGVESSAVGSRGGDERPGSHPITSSLTKCAIVFACDPMGAPLRHSSTCPGRSARVTSSGARHCVWHRGYAQPRCRARTTHRRSSSDGTATTPLLRTSLRYALCSPTPTAGPGRARIPRLTCSRHSRERRRCATLYSANRAKPVDDRPVRATTLNRSRPGE
jgi:hypothetical protein